MARIKKTLDTIELSSFSLTQEIRIDAPPEKVYDAILRDIDQWWAYRLGTADSVIRIEPRVGGRFYEDFGRDQGALWGTITYLKRPERIRFSGPLGMERPVSSLYTYDLQPRRDGTTLTLSHTCFGDLKPGWDKAHQSGWSELLGKFLKAWVEERKGFRAFPAKK